MPAATVADLLNARRVLVYGVTGSGKSTAAVELGAALGLPVHLVDEELGWLPGWVERPRDEVRELAAGIAANPSWVLDSAYSCFRDLVLARADVVVALDYPRLVSLGRLLRRTIGRVITGAECCNGNVETLRRVLSKDSILAWHFRSFARKRAAAKRWSASQDGPHVLRITRPRDMARALRDLQRQRTSPKAGEGIVSGGLPG